MLSSRNGQECSVDDQKLRSYILNYKKEEAFEVLKKGDITDFGRAKALRAAAFKNYRDVIKELLKGDISFDDIQGALDIAVARSNKESIEEFIGYFSEVGSNTYLVGSEGFVNFMSYAMGGPLYKALEKDNAGVIEVFVKKGVVTNIDELLLKAQKGNHHVVYQFLTNEIESKQNEVGLGGEEAGVSDMAKDEAVSNMGEAGE